MSANLELERLLEELERALVLAQAAVGKRQVVQGTAPGVLVVISGRVVVLVRIVVVDFAVILKVCFIAKSFVISVRVVLSLSFGLGLRGRSFLLAKYC